MSSVLGADSDQLARLHSDLMRSAAGWTRCHADAEDLVQGALTRALEKPRPLDQSKIVVWIRVIMNHLAIDFWRREARTVPFDPSLIEAKEAPASEPLASWRRVDVEHVRDALRLCRSPYRETYELHLVQGLSQPEIAQRLDIPPATVSTRLHRARRELRQILEAWLTAPGEGRGVEGGDDDDDVDGALGVRGAAFQRRPRPNARMRL